MRCIKHQGKNQNNTVDLDKGHRKCIKKYLHKNIFSAQAGKWPDQQRVAFPFLLLPQHLPSSSGHIFPSPPSPISHLHTPAKGSHTSGTEQASQSGHTEPVFPAEAPSKVYEFKGSQQSSRVQGTRRQSLLE